uniref:Ig-like domain-containing protein n=1 Tax=Poecilia latipinna TaxID=48699 RepID=A0A3B3TK11_9TELE
FDQWPLIYVGLVAPFDIRYFISPVGNEVNGIEGQLVSLRCKYQTGSVNPNLHWYKQVSDVEAPQFLLWKGAKNQSKESYVPNDRYRSVTTDTSTELQIETATLADSGLYYCRRLYKNLTTDTRLMFEDKRNHKPPLLIQGFCFLLVQGRNGSSSSDLCSRSGSGSGSGETDLMGQHGSYLSSRFQTKASQSFMKF